jgi:hypothetical protein
VFSIIYATGRGSAMTAKVLTGSKQEIAQKVSSIEGRVREVIVFVEEPINPILQTIPETAAELFAEMEPFTVRVDAFDDSRKGIYEPMEGE